MRSPLVSLYHLWDKQQDLVAEIDDLERRQLRELERVARTKHRDAALVELYWDAMERYSVSTLAGAFRVRVKDLSDAAGAKRLSTTCLLCRAHFQVEVTSRSARAELLRESGPNPKRRICPACDRDRLEELRRLRKGKGEPLTAAHREAYRRYLLSPQWRDRRKKALQRARNRCSLCSSKTRLEAHHRTYERIGEERPEDLTVLCERCHAKHHDH